MIQSRSRWRGLIYWGPVIAYAGLIFFLSSRSHPEEDLPSVLGLFSDKVLHAVEYAGLGGLCYRAFRYGAAGPLAARATLWAVVAASVYGVTDEVHQLFVPFRDSSWQDWLADTVGAAVGAAAATKWFGSRGDRTPTLAASPE
ncbi:MAG: VanZ family protein [Nitrospira sp.]